MSDISLYRKYRPQLFSDVVGQEHVSTTLRNAARSDSISHAYLFCGSRGTGKTSVARILAKVLNCEALSSEGEPCLKCGFCVETQEGRLIDLIEIDAASNRGIDEIRDIREKIKFLPTRGKKKVYIIDEVHMLTKEAFNALLKTLEEPPSHAHFILATTEIHKVPETIISRCQRFDFRRIDKTDIVDRLQFIAEKESIEYEKEALLLIAENVHGGLRDAISLFEQISVKGSISLSKVQEILGVGSEASLESFIKNLFDDDTPLLLLQLEDLFHEGQDLGQFAREIIEKLRAKMLEAVKNQEDSIVSRCLKMIEAFEEASFKLKDSIIPQLPLEVAIVKCSGKILKSPVSEPEKPKVAAPKPEIKQIIQDKRPEGISKIQSEEEIITPSIQEYLAFSAENINDNFTRILEHIKTPMIRRSFSDAQPGMIDGREVTFSFRSKFHFEKVNALTHKAEISQAMEEIFGPGVSLHFELENVSFEAMKGEKISMVGENRAQQDMTKEVMDIFGGELV